MQINTNIKLNINQTKSISLKKLPNGSKIKGKITTQKSSGQSFLLYRGDKIPVKIDGLINENITEFILSKKGDTVFLKAVNESLDIKLNQFFLFKNLSKHDKSIILKIIALYKKMDFKVDDEIIEKMLSNFKSITSEFKIFELLFLMYYPKKAKNIKELIMLWCKIIKKHSKKKLKDDDNYTKDLSNNFDNSGKERLNRFIDELKSFFEADDNKENDSLKNNVYFNKPVLIFLPFENDFYSNIIPLLLFPAQNKKVHWLFSEINLSELGAIKIIMNSNHGFIMTEIQCNADKKDYLKKVFKENKNIRICDIFDKSEVFFKWTIDYLLNKSDINYDGFA